MAVSFSLLKDIDFTKTENIIFLFIVLVVALIIFFSVAVFVSKIIKAIKRFIIGDNIKKPKIAREISDKQIPVSSAEEMRSSSGAVRKIINEGVIGRNIITEEKKEINIAEAEKRKAEKKIEEGLGALKADIPDGGLQSKMPVRNEENIEGAGQREIKIPKAKRFAENMEQARGQMDVKNETDIKIPYSSKEIANPSDGNNADSSALFQGRKDVPRMKLEHEMRTNPKIWKAARESMLNLTPIERAKLVKETFSSAYGRNISKTDLKQAVQKLDRKMRSAKTPKEHEKLRKEIKFFKKIGGV